MSHIKQLQDAKTLGQLATLLNIKFGMLSYLLFKKPKAELYTKFEIPKRHGGVREIHAPNHELKLLQHRLSEYLQKCSEEIEASHGHNVKSLGIAHGFKPRHSIMTNGRAHTARRFVFNVDLHDFFGTINFGRVRGFFLKDRNFSLHESIATGIAQIACHENKLPQGSPCSPVISNLIGHTMDIPLAKLAASEGAIYTRYADDITFSTNKPNFPETIAVESNDYTWEPGTRLLRVLQKSGFSINEKKTRMQLRDSRQEVTGLTVNRKVNVTATYRYTTRSMAHALFNTGSFDFIYKKLDENGVEQVRSSKGKPEQLIGMLSHIDQVDLFNRKIRLENGLEPDSTEGRIQLFRRVLYFDKFYALDQPLIVCEGKTDNVYLRCAIKSLAAGYPKLIQTTPELKLSIGFLKYADRRTSEITELTGGVGGICNLLKNYHGDVNTKFKAPPPKHPIIVFIDNDSGADSIYGAIAGITKKPKPLGKAAFIHVTANLYVVPTPINEAKPKTDIEDFFDTATLATVVDGRTFHKSKGPDTVKHYAKATFAKDVVAKNAHTIDFGRFKPLLDRIVSVIDDYQLKLKAK